MDFLSFFRDKVILVFGGTGSIGTEIVKQLLKWSPKTIRIFSNSENELWESKLSYKDTENNLRFLLGDIRNYQRVKRAVDGVDYIFNAAAIKHVSFSEYNPLEAINVNIHGLENIIEAAFEHNVKSIVHISTDKAVSPTSVMGATKMLSERICISRDSAKGKHPTTISCVRFGNVLGSRGSIIPLIKKQIKNGNEITLTDEKMNRFFMSIADAGKLVLKSMIQAKGGEIFVFKMPTIRVKDLLEVLIQEFAPQFGKNPSSIKIKTIGSRNGEKLDEDLISRIEYHYCDEIDDMFIIRPPKESNEVILKNEDSMVKKVAILKKDKNYCTNSQDPIDKTKIKEILKKLNLI